MPARKHRKGISVSLYLSPERLDLLAVADNQHAGTHARLAIMDAIDGKLDRVDREYVKRAAMADSLSMPEWCRQTLLMAARKRLGLPAWDDEPSASPPRANVASKPVDGPRYEREPYSDQENDIKQRKQEQAKFAARAKQKQTDNPELDAGKRNMEALLAKLEVPS